MYELIIKDFSNYELIFKEIISIRRLDYFISNFGTIETSTNLEYLFKKKKELKLRTMIIPYLNHSNLNIKLLKINHLLLYLDKIEFNFKERINIKDIFSLSIQPIRETIRKDFYFTLKFLTSNFILWTDKNLRIYSKIKSFYISQNYQENIKNLISFIISLNQKIKMSPLINIYLNNDIKTLRYFTTEIPSEKDFLWMKKIKILNI